MNDLNSVLIEGIVINNATMSKDYCKFKISSNRFYKQKDELKRETSLITIEAYYKLAKLNNGVLKGCKIRVVGRLKQNEDEIVIIAEHVEIRQ